jgi:cell pole-organizing protein PopZ
LPSAGQEAASALERAIAALKAGQVPTSTPEPIQFQAAPAPAPEVTPEPLPMAVPMDAQEPSPETHPEPEPLFEPQVEVETSFEAQPKLAPTLEMMPDAEALEVVAEVEVTTLVTEELVELEASDEDVEKAPFWPADMAASEAEATPEATAEPETTPEALAEPETGPVFDVDPVLKAEPIAKFINGAQRPEGESKTLEDSVKDMLRPMLRQWLDDNMPRMVKDQLGDDVSPGQQD